MAAADAHVRVLHRADKQGLGRAYMDGFQAAIDDGALQVVQMDADGQHNPDYLPSLVGGLDKADLVIGSRYVKGGGVPNWVLFRKLVSRGGSTFARVVLGLKPHDLTGGFKAWRRDILAATPWNILHSGGYVFQIEMTYLASRRGARIIERPIVFAEREGGVSKMSSKIIFEALLVVVRLRWQQFRGRIPGPVGSARPKGGQRQNSCCRASRRAGSGRRWRQRAWSSTSGRCRSPSAHR